MIPLSPERFRFLAREVTLSLDAAGLETRGPTGRFGEPKSAEDMIRLLDRACDELRGAERAYRRCRDGAMSRAATDALKTLERIADELADPDEREFFADAQSAL